MQDCVEMGIPISSDFNDIDDIKHILRDVINTLFNMTKKIDNMQKAIDFINDQLHEERRPLFRLGDTLKNMTASLDNLKLNLKSINTTLDGFKEYLKQFDNTIFDVQDVLKYLDETFNNLDKTVSFVGNSLQEMDDSVEFVDDVFIRGNSSLEHFNNSAYGVKETTNFANKTLESMSRTLESLENAVSGLNVMVDDVLISMTGMNISLMSINGTVQKSYRKMNNISEKMKKMNFSVDSIENTVARLNKTYTDINDALSQLNETFVFINGSTKDAIRQLQYTDERLHNISRNMFRMRNGMASMNVSLEETMDWMKNMVKTLKKFNAGLDRQNDTLTVNLQNTDVIETLSVLLGMNHTLMEFGYNVDHINRKLDEMESNLRGLETNLDQLQDTLNNLNVTFREINTSIETSNETVRLIKQSLGLMNSSFDAINKTLSDLTNEFININQTLESINSSLLLVNENVNKVVNRSLEINSTFAKINDKINEMSTQIDSISVNMHNDISNKSLSDLRENLQKTYASMEKVEDQKKSINQSNKLLKSTLHGLGSAVENLLSRVNQSDDSLLRVNKSFKNIEDSIQNMEQTKKDWNVLLNKLINSSRVMNNNMKDLGFAFPNMVTNLNDLNRSISRLEEQIVNQSLAIKRQNDTKESSYKRFLKLAQFKQHIHIILNDTIQSIKATKKISEATDSKLEDFDTKFEGLSSQYDNMKRNIELFNNSLSPVQERYNNILNDIVVSTSSMYNISKVFENHNLELKRMENSSNDFLNLNVPFTDIQQTLTDNSLSTKENLILLKAIKENITEEASIFWNDIVEPMGIDKPHLQNKRRFKNINSAIDHTKNDLMKTFNDITNLSNCSNDIEDAITNISRMISNMKRFKNLAFESENVVQELDDHLNLKQNQSLASQEYIDNLTKYLKDLELRYGSINGTSNVTMNEYDIIETLLFEASQKFDNFSNSLGDLRLKSANLKKKVNNTISSYTKYSFDIDTNSQDKIKTLISDIINYRDHVNDTKLLIKQSSLEETNMALKNIDSLLKTLEDNLKDKNDKHNLLKKIRPFVINRFSSIDFQLINGNNSIENFQSRMLELLKYADRLSKRLNNNPNVNIMLGKEYELLKGVDKSLMNFHENMSSLNSSLTNAKNRFASLQKTNLSFEEVNRNSKELKNEIQTLNETAERLNKDIFGVEGDLDLVSSNLHNVERLLDMYDKTFENTEELNSDLDLINNKSITTEKVLKDIDFAVQKIEYIFQNLQNNYTNLTETNVNLKDQFLVDTISEVKNSVFDLLNRFESLTNSSSSLVDKILFLRNIIIGSKLDRTNLENIIEESVTKETEKMRDDIDYLNISLNSINEEVKTLNTQITDLDEILYLTNNQLLIDKQKKMFAEMNLPKLKDRRNFIDKKLMQFDSIFLNVTKRINGTIRDYHHVANRLDEPSNSNISIDNYFGNISNLQKKMSLIQEKIQSLSVDMSDVNVQLLTDQGGYTVNDAIDTIKSRFKNASDKMDLIYKDIDNVQNELDMVTEDTDMIHDKVASVNDTLNDYDMVNSNWLEFEKKFRKLEQMSKIAKSKHEILDLQIRNMTKDINNLSRRSSAINNSIINDLLGDLHKNLSKSDTGFKEFTAFVERLMENVDLIGKKLHEESENNSSTLFNTDNLDEMNFIRKQRLNEANVVLDSTSLLFDDINNKSIMLTNQLEALFDEVSNVREFLKSEEKKNLYTRFSPENRFNNANITLQNLTNLIQILQKNISDVSDYANDVKSYFDIVNNLNISFDPTMNILDKANSTVNQDTFVLENEIERLKALKMLLETKDGKPFSHAESILEMKERYNTLDFGIQKILGTSENISDRFLELSDTIPKTMGKLVDAHSLLKKYENANERLNDTFNSMSTLNEAIDRNEEEHNKRRRKLRKLSDQFKILKTEFDNVSSSNVVELIRLTDAKLKLEYDLFVNITNKLKKIQKKSDHVNKKINYLSEMSNQTFSSMDDLETFLKDYTNISSKVDTNIKLINDNRHVYSNQSVSFDENFDLVQRMVENLTEILENQKRKSFLHSTTNRIKKIYQNIMPRLETESMFLNDMTKELNKTIGQISDLDSIISNMTYTDLTLDFEKNAIKTDNDSLFESKAKLQTMHLIMEEVHEKLLNMDSDGFIRNNSIDTIEEIFFDLMTSTDNVSLNIKHVSKVLLNTNISIAETNDNLSSLQAALLLRKELAFRQENSKNRYDNATDLYNDTQRKEHMNQALIKEINNTLVSLTNKYTMIHDSDLWKRYDALEIDFKHNLNDFANTKKKGGKKNLTLSKSGLLMDKISIAINEPIFNLTGLEKNNIELEQIFDKLDHLLDNVSGEIHQDSLKQGNLNMDLKSLKKDLEKIEKEFKKRKIMNFMKVQFPRVLDRFTFVNETLKVAEDKLDIAKSLVNQLKQGVNRTDSIIESHPFINISLSNQRNFSRAVSNVLRESFTKRDLIAEELKNISDIISDRIDRNDTIDLIEGRIGDYIENLDTIFVDIDKLNTTVERVTVRSNEAISSLNDVDKEIEKIQNLEKKRMSTKYHLIRFKEQFSNKHEKHDTNRDILNTMKELLLELDHNITNSNKTELQTELDTVAKAVNEIDLQINRTDVKVLDLERLLREGFEKLNDTHALTEQPITELNRLTNISEIMKKMLYDVDKEIKDVFESLIPSLKKTIQNDFELLNVTNSRINALREKFLLDEKESYLNYIIPKTLNSHKRLHERITIITEDFSQIDDKIKNLNVSLDRTYANVQNNDYINFNLSNLKDVLEGSEDDMKYYSSFFDENKNEFYGIDGRVLRKPYWKNNTTNEIQHAIENIVTKLADIDINMTAINRTNSDIIDDIVKIEGNVSYISGLIELYDKLNQTNSHQQNLLKHADDLLNKTRDRVEKLSSSFEEQKNILTRLNNTIGNRKNNTISKLMDDIEQILIDKVELRLPLLGNMFQKRIFEKLKKARNLHKYNTGVLTKVHTSPDALDKALNVVERNTETFASKIKVMNTSNISFNQEISKLDSNLNETKNLLESLDYYIKSELKRRYINKVIPEMSKTFDNIKGVIENMTGMVPDLEETANKTKSDLRSVIKSAEKFENINISFDSLIHGINESMMILNDNKNNFPEMFASLRSLSPNHLYRQNLVHNESVTLSDLQTFVENLRDDIYEIENTTMTTLDDLIQINKSSADFADDIKEFGDNILQYGVLVEKRVNITADMEKVESYAMNISIGLKTAKDGLAILNETIQSLYGMYNINDHLNEKILNLTTEAARKIGNFEKEFTGALDFKSEINETLHETDILLVAQINTSSLLNLTISEGKRIIPETEKRISQLVQSMKRINAAMPTITQSVDNFKEEIELINITLKNEDSKSKYVNKEQPILYARYQDVNATFDMTNKSLHIIQENIKLLEEQIQRVKQNMDMHQTINIDMSTMEANVTNMENRLAIMKGHYNNVDEVVAMLKNDLNSYRYQQNNMSLNETKLMYKDFNKSIDNVEKVLRKIDTEIADMDDQFMFMNDTIFTIDDAIKSFQAEQDKNENRHKELETIERSLNATKADLSEITSSYTSLNNSFQIMQSIYKDVINTTAENNTQFLEDITNVKAEIDLFKRSANNLFVDKTTANEIYLNMNQSLFRPVNTYNELNDTLADFSILFNNLTSIVNSLSDNMGKARSKSAALNMSLSNLGDVLQKINKTLDDEQTKYNFLNSNLGGLQSKSNQIATMLDGTNSSMKYVDSIIKAANETLRALYKQLNDNDRLNITIENELDTIYNSTENIKSIKRRLYTAQDEFKKLISNLAFASDRSGKISDIKQRYDNFNSSLDSLLEKLDIMDMVIGDTTNKTKTTGILSNGILKSVQTFEEVTANVSKSISNMDLVKNNLRKPKESISENVNSIHILEKQAQDMFDSYKDVQDQDLKKNLTSLMRELSSEKQKLSALSNRQLEINGRHDNATKSIRAIENLLNGTFNQKDQLDKAINYSRERMIQLDKHTIDLNIENNALQEEADLVQLRISRIESQMSDLNETFFEEQMKINFVKSNFPSAKTRFEMLEKSITKSNDDLQNKSNTLSVIRNKLSELKTVFDSIPSVDLALNVENAKSDEIENDASELKQFLNNITEQFNMFDMLKLKDRQKSFSNLKGDYAIYNNAAESLENSIVTMGKRLNDLNEKLLNLNMTTLDISFILDTFKDVNKNASTFFNDIKKYNDSFGDINNSLLDMNIKLTQLNDTLINAMAKFTDVKDPVLLKAKDTLEEMVLNAFNELSKLKQTSKDIGNLNTQTREKGNSLDSVLSKSKSSLKELKLDIASANSLFNNISSLLDILNISQNATNESINSLNPNVKSISDEINKLYTKFETEQRKLNYIKQEVPILETSFRNLKGPLESTNKKLADAEMNLSDLKLKIDSIGARLKRFKPIHITTDIEEKSWQNLSETMKNKSHDFIQLSKMYNNLSKEILHIGRKNESIEHLKSMYQTINATIDKIAQGLSSINNNLTEISIKHGSIYDVLEEFGRIMDDFKLVQVKYKSLKKNIEVNAKNIVKVNGKSKTLKKKVSLMADLLQNMEQMFKQLHDERLKRNLPQIKKKISNFDSGITRIVSTLNSLTASVNESRSIVDNTSNALQYSGLKRDNATNVINSVNRTVATTSAKLINITQETSNANRSLSLLTNDIDMTKQELESLNKSLSEELRKARFVNRTLPDLRAKHTRVNATFSGTVPDIQILRSQIDDVVSVISKIKEKMQAFGLQDTDKTILNWDQSIGRLNKTVIDIIKRNRQTSTKIKELKQKLWKEGPMYTEVESFKEVKERFNGYNNSLNEIMAAVHKIEVKLVDLDKTSQDLTATLIDHEEMLTTTPEPMGPPIWLQFTSTTVGTIGKDPGVAECSVGDLTDWDVMKITRQRKGKKEETVAAWKLGVGARKTIRERRMSVKKSENTTGGSLKINIRSLQCEDEAAYYCSIDTYRRYPLRTDIAVITPPEDSLDPDFPTEVFEDKIANFSCTGHPGYPNGRLIWKIKHQNEKQFKDYNFYSAKTQVSDTDCIRTENNHVEHQFDMSWNNTKIRCYIENTQYYGEGIIRLLPYDICNKVRFLGTISHPYTPHKYIVCGKELNIMQCPGNTCYDKREENCVQCAASQQSADPCHGKPLYSYVAHERDCKKYYICMGPTKTVKKCTKGYFNPNRPGNCVMSYPESYCAQRSG